MYTIITENDESQWDDTTGIRYHFPNRYLKFLKEGTDIIYYKGRLQNKKFESKRLSNAPHYFGVGKVGKLLKDGSSTNYFVEIKNFQIFPHPVVFKTGDQYIEQIPESLKSNYWRNGVRPTSKEVYDKIIRLSKISIGEGDQKDQQENELITTTVEGGKSKVYTTKYERKRESRDQALKIHGYTCMVCDFNFKQFYGNVGEGYIHVHHLKPLSSNNEEVVVNPKTDLAVVCPNCHAMIHRKKNVVLSIEDLRSIVKLNKK